MTTPTHRSSSLEKVGRDNAIEQLRTAQSVSMSPELFEKLYLSPENAVKGDLRKTFGNPTPIALIGFLISLTPLSCDLMGWRGAGGNGAASMGSYFFFGGPLLLLGGVLEWILGNTFPSVVFCTFGSFWLAFGATLNPAFSAFTSYAPVDAESPTEGLATQGFNASFGFFTLAMAMICIVFLVCSLRTNICFFVIFLSLIVAFGLLTGAYWVLAEDFEGNADLASKLIVGAGASAFVTCMSGWWILFAIMLAVLDFPFQIPVGDLSTLIRGANHRVHHDGEA